VRALGGRDVDPGEPHDEVAHAGLHALVEEREQLLGPVAAARPVVGHGRQAVRLAHLDLEPVEGLDAAHDRAEQPGLVRAERDQADARAPARARQRARGRTRASRRGRGVLALGVSRVGRRSDHGNQGTGHERAPHEGAV
jgi:hypothetical protein